jgi:hypothetical protein
VSNLTFFVHLFMGTINEMLQAFQKVNLPLKVPEIIAETSGEITKFIQLQLIEGKDATGESIVPDYKKSFFNSGYAEMKNEMNPLPGYGTPDFLLTGELYRNLNVTVSDDEYDIESDVPYALDDSITSRGPEPFMLSDENKGNYAQTSLLPAILTYITETTGVEII